MDTHSWDSHSPVLCCSVCHLNCCGLAGCSMTSCSTSDYLVFPGDNRECLLVLHRQHVVSWSNVKVVYGVVNVVVEAT